MAIAERHGARSFVAFPHLAEPLAYRARTFDYLVQPQNEQAADRAVQYTVWVDMFRSSIPSFKKQALQDCSVKDAQAKAERFAVNYGKMLDGLAADPWAELPGHGSAEIDCVRLCRLRESCLRDEGFGDIFAAVKEAENMKALQMLPSVLRDLDAQQDDKLRLSQALHGVFAGNIFDLGAAASAQLFEVAGSSFVQTRESLLPRPWVIDHFDQIIQLLGEHQYRKAMLFVDNAGSDVVLGMLPFARELLRRGTQVVLAANSIPSINDVTAAELSSIVARSAEADKPLARAVAEQTLMVVESGNDLPVIDLAQVSLALAEASQGVDLVVLEGMGRAIETNLNADLICDRLNLGMIKHPEVAKLLGGRLYDCVCKLSRGQHHPSADIH